MASLLKNRYRESIQTSLQKDLSFSSIMQVPRLVKICINKGLGKAVSNKKFIDEGIEELTLISGQKAVATSARKSISGFKLRQGSSIGVKITLRGDKMYSFIDRLINIALPRVRDFNGLSDKGFDGRGNYNIGIKEQIIFPELSIDKVKSISGFQITIVTSSEKDNVSYKLLKAFGMPFKK